MVKLQNRVLDYLRGHNAMSLATSYDEQPHAATVFYVNDRFDLYFISSPSSRHGQHLAANKRVAATVNEDYSNWDQIKGLQLDGNVKRIGPLSANAEVARKFAKKFPDTSGFFRDPRELPDAVAAKVADVHCYRLQPIRFAYIDNSLGFGHREQLSIEVSTPVGKKDDDI